VFDGRGTITAVTTIGCWPFQSSVLPIALSALPKYFSAVRRDSTSASGLSSAPSRLPAATGNWNTLNTLESAQ
jgi:hypothetical protein